MSIAAARVEKPDDLPREPGAVAGGLYLRPIGIVSGSAARDALPRGGLPIAGGPLACREVECIWRADKRDSKIHRATLLARDINPRIASGALPAAIADRLNSLLDRISARRSVPQGLDGDAPWIMGVVNVTPDSFSDGGDHETAAAAIAHGQRLAEQGAAILDIGGESTRPGAAPVTPEDEAQRVIPVIEGLREATPALLSIDTRNPATMRSATAAGTHIINDVTALASTTDSVHAAAASALPVVLMHMLGEPRTMQKSPSYHCAPLDVFDYLEERIAACEEAGIPRARIIVDPGIGFGKTVTHNLEILDHLGLLHGLGCPLLLGVSRKSFIGRLSREEPPKDRVPGSLAAAIAGLDAGVQFLRVHDVAETAQAVAVWRGIRNR